MIIDDREYLKPPNNEAKSVFKCDFCNEWIYEGDNYYLLDGFNCCVECLDSHFRCMAEPIDYEMERADIEYNDKT